jgi:antitoxin component YwqK of YwqJK toxin-antitoxin module
MLHPFTTAALAASILCVGYSQAQDKTATVPVAEPNANFTLFTNSVTGHYPFQLPLSGSITELKDETVLVSALVKNHRLHGQWKTAYTNGQLLDEGKLVKGLQDGLWQSWYANGQLRSVRNYSAGLFTSIQQDVQLNHPKLSRFVITERYKKEGRAVLQVFQTVYSFNTSKLKMPANPVELAQSNRSNSQQYLPPFSNALHHGEYINYFENGVTKDSGYYKEGLKEGIWLHRADAGTGLWKGMYKHGVKQKEWKYYNAAGKLKLIVFFNNRGEEEWRKQL